MFYFKQNAFLRSWTYAVFYGCFFFFFFFFFMFLYAITLRVIYINTDQLLTGFYYDKPGSPPPPPPAFSFLFSRAINPICNKKQRDM